MLNSITGMTSSSRNTAIALAMPGWSSEKPLRYSSRARTFASSWDEPAG